MTDENTKYKRIIIVSDGTGETASLMVRAAMVQFSGHDVYFTRYKNVRSREQIIAICEDAEREETLVIFTIVDPELREFLRKEARRRRVPSVDLLGPTLSRLAVYFGYEPNAVAGLLHGVNERYFQRIEAMEYSIAHDDGRDLAELDQADLVILGISRTSKTPLSMYLAHQGWKVVNIPIIKGFQIPQEIFNMDQRKIVCLTIDTETLATIRRNRLQRLGQDEGGEYANPDKVVEEIEYANELFRKHRRWPTFNVTGKALEETASEIMKLMAARRLLPSATLESHPPLAPSEMESAKIKRTELEEPQAPKSTTPSNVVPLKPKTTTRPRKKAKKASKKKVAKKTKAKKSGQKKRSVAKTRTKKKTKRK